MTIKLSEYHELDDTIYIYGADRQSSNNWSASHAHMIAENVIRIGIKKVEKTGSPVRLETYCGHDSVLIPSKNPQKIWDKVVLAENVQKRSLSHGEPNYRFGENPCGNCVNIFDNVRRYQNDER
jgi:hypothetical protein